MLTIIGCAVLFAIVGGVCETYRYNKRKKAGIN